MSNVIIHRFFPASGLPEVDNAKSLSLTTSGYVNTQQSEPYGNGTTDDPFTIWAWVKHSDGVFASKTIMSAGVNTNNMEWIFFHEGAGKLRLTLYDGRTSVQIGQRALVASSGTGWQFFAGTYDGSGNASGVTLYDASGVLASEAVTLGSYVAMDGAARPILVGRFPGGGLDYSGLLDYCGLANEEKDASGIATIAGCPQREVANASHLWLFEDDYEDYVTAVTGINVGTGQSFSTDTPC